MVYRLIIVLICVSWLFGIADYRSNTSSTTINHNTEFDRAVGLIEKKEYAEAKETLLNLQNKVLLEESRNDVELLGDINYAMACISLKGGDYYEAYDYYNSSYVYYSEDSNMKDKATDARMQLASVESAYMERDEHALSEFLSIYEESEEPKYKYTALAWAASLYINMENREKTEESIRILKEYVEKTSPTKELDSFMDVGKDDDEIKEDIILGRLMNYDQFIDAYRIIGYYYSVYDEPDESIKYYRSAIDILDGLKVQDEESRMALYEDLAFIYLYFKGETEDNYYLQKIIDLTEQTYPPGVEKARNYADIAEMYFAMGNLDEFYGYMTKALEMAEDTVGHNHWLVSNCKIRQSVYYRRIGEYKKAILCCEEAIEIEKNTLQEGSRSIAADYNNLAGCYADAGMKEEAVNAFLQAIELYRSSNNDLQLAVADRNVALIYNNSLCDHESALRYAREAVSLVEDMDEEYYGGTIAAIYMVMGEILEPYDWDYYLIEEYSEKAFARLQNSVGNVDDATANYYYTLGKYYSDNERYLEALSKYESAEELFERVYTEPVLYPIDIYHDIAICHYYTGNHDEALDYFEKSVEYDNKHIDMLYDQGNYRTAYWENTRRDSLLFIDAIEEK